MPWAINGSCASWTEYATSRTRPQGHLGLRVEGNPSTHSWRGQGGDKESGGSHARVSTACAIVCIITNLLQLDEPGRAPQAEFCWMPLDALAWSPLLGGRARPDEESDRREAAGQDSPGARSLTLAPPSVGGQVPMAGHARLAGSPLVDQKSGSPGGASLPRPPGPA